MGLRDSRRAWIYERILDGVNDVRVTEKEWNAREQNTKKK